MTQLTDRVDAFKLALSQDADLLAWCLAQYGRAPIVHAFGSDQRNPPGADECPYMILRPISSTTGRGQTQRTRRFELIFALYDETSELNPDTSILEYRGGRNLCEFVELGLRALGAQDIGNELLGLADAEMENLETFPFFLAAVPVVMTEDLVLSADRLAL